MSKEIIELTTPTLTGTPQFRRRQEKRAAKKAIKKDNRVHVKDKRRQTKPR